MQDWQEWIGAALAVVLALVALALAVALRRARARADRAELAALDARAESRAEVEALRHRLDELEHRVRRSAVADRPEFLITHLGEDEPGVSGAADASAAAGDGATLGSALFADLVLRETVVKAAGLAHGVRRALDPETRARIRFEMRRELKRARKQRRADDRQARREWQAQQRASFGTGTP